MDDNEGQRGQGEVGVETQVKAGDGQDQQQDAQAQEQLRQAPDGFASWPDYWKAQGMPWRTEPEIDEERQSLLAGRMIAMPTSFETQPMLKALREGLYPFKGMRLSRADVEWLVALKTERINLSELGVKLPRSTVLDLRGATLQGETLAGLPLKELIAGLPTMLWIMSRSEEREMAAVHMEECNLRNAVLDGAILGGAHLEAALLEEADLRGADLTAAHLEKATLNHTHLEDAVLGTRHEEGAVGAYLEGCSLWKAHIERADLSGASLLGANLDDAHLENADLSDARLAGATLRGARLDGANLAGASFEALSVAASTVSRVGKWTKWPASEGGFPDRLPSADLRRAVLSSTTRLDDVNLSAPFIVDVRWNDANLAVADWSQFRPLQDETSAIRTGAIRGRRKWRMRFRDELAVAVRANRQFATTLRSQGLNEHADRFAYRAQLCQRIVLRRQRYYLRYLGSLFLGLIAGYGYRPLRAFAAYDLVVLTFAAAYFALGIVDTAHALSWNEALVVSMTAFHGRGFFASAFSPGDPQAAVAAVEALIGLLIEITFIATFTNRFFAR